MMCVRCINSPFWYTSSNVKNKSIFKLNGLTTIDKGCTLFSLFQPLKIYFSFLCLKLCNISWLVWNTVVNGCRFTTSKHNSSSQVHVSNPTKQHKMCCIWNVKECNDRNIFYCDGNSKTKIN